MTRFPRSGRVGVVGKDGRTHAIAEACRQSLPKSQVVAISELMLPGLVESCDSVEQVANLGPSEIEDWARRVKPDLVIVGPEDPLAAGVVDRLQELGVATFGPTRALAQIESSKVWARQLLDRHSIQGNPSYRIFESTLGLRDHLLALGEFVVKPDGLTGGKGVRLYPDHFTDLDEAVAYADECISASKDSRVLVEERLDGEEFSLMTITDGSTSVHCPAVQDHKRAYDGDSGPNTGGMGSYSCADFSLPFLTDADLAEARRINERVVEALFSDSGVRYCGVLYGGFIVTGNGVRLIEYNARFGDPEALNILPLLKTEFVDIAWACTQGELHSLGPVAFEALATVCKYLVPNSYPEAKDESGSQVSVSVSLRDRSDVRVFWAACEESDGQALLTGSRALAVVGIGKDLESAEAIAEEAACAIDGPVRHRKDIGTAALIDARLEHMAKVRQHPIVV